MQEELKKRTKALAIAIINLEDTLPKSTASRIVLNQIIRSATSVGANYRAVCRARSDREFISKMSIVLEECDEVCFWLEIIEEKKWQEIATLWQEANELTAIFVSSLKSIKSRLKKS